MIKFTQPKEQTQNQSLQQLSDTELLNQTKTLAEEERKITIQILHHLAEVERRRLFAIGGHSSLFEYCIRELGYSESAAQRRISSMRLLNSLPEVESKIREGSLSLSNLAEAQKHFRTEARNNHPLSDAEKREVLKNLEGKSTREAQRELASHSSSPESLLPEDQIKPLTSTHSLVKFAADQSLLNDLEQIRGLLAHRSPDLTLAELIAEMAKVTLGKLDPAKSKAKAKSTPASETKVENQTEAKSEPDPEPKTKTSRSTADAGTKNRTVPAQIRRSVWARDQGQCTYQDPATGKRCQSRFALEMDHLQPFSQGGPTTLENLALKCRTHNQLHAIQSYGLDKMAKYLT